MKKWIALLLTLATVLSLSACGSTAGSAGGKTKKQNQAMYIKDKELFFANLDGQEDAWQVTSRMLDDEGIGNAQMWKVDDLLAVYSYISEDGSLIFFPDKISSKDADTGLNLYYRKTKDQEADAVKIDSEVTSYKVNPSATTVTYTKGEEHSLYQYSVKDDSKEKIANEISQYNSYNISKDGSKLLFVDAEGNLFVKAGGQDKEKIASDITEVVHYTDDFATVYYIKNDALYKQAMGQDREKISSNVYRVLRSYESGEMFYLKREEAEISLMDYVVDDMQEADAAAPQDKPSMPYSWNYNTTKEYNEAYDAYKEASNSYWARAARDEMRVSLTKAALSHNTYTLCYFNGTEETVLTEDFSKINAAAIDAPVLVYQVYNPTTFNKVKLSEITSIDELSTKVDEALFASSDYCIAVKGAQTVFDQDDATGICMNDLGTEIYYLAEIPEGKDAGELYKVSIAEGVVSAPELYDSEVYSKSMEFVSDNRFLYFKDFKDGSGDLYANKVMVDYDVQMSTVRYNSDKDTILYMIDYSTEKGCGTLKEYKTEETVKVADDVYDSYMVAPGGKTLYLYDYSQKYYAGELYMWDNGEAKKIDEDVTLLIPMGFKPHGWTVHTLAAKPAPVEAPSVPETEAPAAY